MPEPRNSVAFCVASEQMQQVFVASDAPAIAPFARYGLLKIATSITSLFRAMLSTRHVVSQARQRSEDHL